MMPRERAYRLARTFAAERLALVVKEPAQNGRSRDRLLLCANRIRPDRLLLSRRRKRRYGECRRRWKQAYSEDQTVATALQSRYRGALAITLHADSAASRREQLRRAPLAASLAGL